MSPHAPSYTPLGDIVDSAEPGFACGDDVSQGLLQLRMNNVTADGTLDWKDRRRVPAGAADLDRYGLEPGDIMFNCTNSPELVGKTALFPGFSEPVAYSNHFLRIRVDRKGAEPAYVSWLLHRRWQRRVFERLAIRWVNQATVRKDDLLDMQILLPDLPIQRRIAAILDRADRLRRMHRYALELSDQFLPALFLRMFGDPATNPRGWSLKPLRSLCDRLSDGPFGSDLKSSHYRQRGVRVIRLQNIGVGSFLDADEAYVADEHFQSLRQHECVAGDVVIGTLGDPNLRACVLPSGIGPAMNKADCVQARVNPNEATPEYVCWLMNMPETLSSAGGLVHGQTRSRVSMGQLAVLRVPSPPLGLQQSYSLAVDQFERHRAANREALRQAEHLFQSLLSRYFGDEG